MIDAEKIKEVVQRWEYLVEAHGRFGGTPESSDFIWSYAEIDEVMGALKEWLANEKFD